MKARYFKKFLKKFESQKNYQNIFKKFPMESTNVNNEEATSLAKTNFSSGFVARNQKVIVPFILLCLNLLNVTDRYIISSVLIDIEHFFGISKSTAGLLQTTFLLVYMASSPIFGYFGDRVNRKYLLLLSAVIWITGSISGSFVQKDSFVLFLLSRCLFGIATGAFETIAVPITGDLFEGDQKGRGWALLVFNFGAPIGTGLAYLLTLILKDLNINDWRYSMLVTTPFLGFTFILTLFGFREPRKCKELKNQSVDDQVIAQISNGFISDVKVLSKNKTYLLMTAGWTCLLGAYGKFKFYLNIRGIFQKQSNFIRV